MAKGTGEKTDQQPILADGHGWTIDAVIERFHQDVYRYAFRLCGNVPDAEDLTQQVFLVAHQRLGQLRDRTRIRGWLRAITRSQFCRLCRKTRPRLADDVDVRLDAIPQMPPSDALDAEALQAALDELDDFQRVVVLMYYMEHLSYREIAEALGIPIGTVMSRLARAKSRLRARLVASEFSHESSPS